VKIEVDMAAFRALNIFARGKSPRTEVIRSLFGLRKKRVDFDVLERVLVFSCSNDAADAGRSGGKAKASAKGHGGAKLEPSTLNLKLFRGIPVPDMEMLLPNTRLRMRKLDQAVVFVPAAVSVTLAASKVIFSITAIIGLVKFWIGLEREQPIQSGGWGLVAAGSFTLLGITMGAWTKYQKRRLEYANAHSKTLYFQTLDSESGAFLRVLDEAFEEEAKEATLAYAFLMAHGPSTEAALDAPRALMMALPRVATVWTKSPMSQSRPTFSMTGTPPTVALLKSGTIVSLWLPQMTMRETSPAPAPTFQWVCDVTAVLGRLADAFTPFAARALVARGQIEFTGGGWVQNDEAITRFEDTIDQLTLGHLWAASALGAP